jgi:hypothetical protein
MYNVLRTLVPNSTARIRTNDLDSRLPSPYTGGKYSDEEMANARVELARACHRMMLPDIGALIEGLREELERKGLERAIGYRPLGDFLDSGVFRAFEAEQRAERQRARQTKYPDYLPAAPPLPRVHVAPPLSVRWLPRLTGLIVFTMGVILLLLRLLK